MNQNLSDRVRHGTTTAYGNPYSCRCIECKLAMRLYLREWRSRDPISHRNKNLKKLYKLTHEDYLVMLDAQNGACALCDFVPGDTHLDIDHDHSCCPGKVTCGECIRGLLCNTCNQKVGLYERSDKERIEEYIDSYRTVS